MADNWDSFLSGITPTEPFKVEIRRPVAMITGGTRGVGAGIAEQFAKDGYNLILGFRANMDVAEKFREYLLAKYGEQYSSNKQDVTAEKVVLVAGSILDDTIVGRYFKVVDELFEGNLNVLVHNASQIYIPEGDNRSPYEIGQPDGKFGSLLETGSNSEEKVDFTILDHYTNIYSKTLINFSERAVKRMKNDNGSIIFISSPGCNNTEPVRPGYAIPGFGKSSGEFAIRYYAKNLLTRGINANTIIPGVVNTDIWLGKLKNIGPNHELKTRDELVDHICKQTGQPRVLEPSEIGKVATFLCKDGKCITGMSINADFGIHLGAH